MMSEHGTTREQRNEENEGKRKEENSLSFPLKEEQKWKKEEEVKDLKMDENVTLVSASMMKKTIVGGEREKDQTGTTKTTNSTSSSVHVMDDRKFLSTPV